MNLLIEYRYKVQFDLETEGLEPETNAIFQIGIKDNKGFEVVLETKGETPKERRESEKSNLIQFFKYLDDLMPDIITAYNSENFDWPFIEKRCERLGLKFDEIAKTLNPNVKIRRIETPGHTGTETGRITTTTRHV